MSVRVIAVCAGPAAEYVVGFGSGTAEALRVLRQLLRNGRQHHQPGVDKMRHGAGRDAEGATGRAP